jgi:serine O-acetyltransferase
LIHNRLSNKYFIQIPRQTRIGYGLYIGHHICIVVSPSAKIGNNVNLSQFTTIGSNHGKAATIGNNVYIGPNVCIVEDVSIGNNCSIGAGSVVTKDIQENATVAGVPAKVLSYRDPGRYITHRWQLTDNE